MKLNIIQLILEDLEKEQKKTMAIKDDFEKAKGIQIAIDTINKNKDWYLKWAKNFVLDEFFNSDKDPFILTSDSDTTTSIYELLRPLLLKQDFESQYKRANTLKEKIICKIINITNGIYRDVLGRTILLEKDYEQKKKEYVNSNGKVS